ncbi:fructoselysine 6-kinase [Sedimentibacter hydroxybenzoicus DSM 7310]|uniref:Fructoselysine 6-kinase n=1 Tax=Sedimentibacter hydroxybenzoicus DSM 7310 TaxID=1123245 RepID=A0A974GVH8_SEDHY|nr:fructoselysine 6-kinase [Sedimentibacter hydroxybenzoicus]NYB73359.1 fructoselysine 6-kinase [Sedimentibacter hydroxybenzoicus DSM 7310]
MDKKISIAAVGDNCIDFYDNTGEYYAGGNPVNVAVYVKRMNGNSSYTGVVGNDDYGRFMIEAITAKGVDTSHIRILNGKTAITHVEIKNGDRILGEYEEGVMADFKLTEEDIDFLCSHDLVVTGIWGMIESELYKIKGRGVPVAFDFADKLDYEITQKAVPFVDYAFFSCDSKSDDELHEFMKFIKSKGPGIVVVTRGEKGSIAYDGNEFSSFGIIECDVVDSMGAGDSYIAGFLMGILEGKSVEDCMKKGALSSSETIEYFGAW